MGLVKTNDVKESNSITDLFGYDEQQGNDFVKKLDEKVDVLLEKIQKDELKNTLESLNYMNENFSTQEILFMANVHIVERFQRNHQNPIADLLEALEKNEE